MIIWQVNFQTLRPMQTFSRPVTICRERVNSVTYHHEGRFRMNETSCLFKYTLSGEGIFRDAAGEHRVPAGHAFLCTINDPATSYYYPEHGTEPWEFVYCNIEGETAHAKTRELTEKFGPVFKLNREEGIVSTLLSYKNFKQTQPLLSSAEAARLASQIFADLLASKDKPLQDHPSTSLSIKAMRIVQNNLDKNINVSELAQKLNVSREHLTRVFKEQTTQTPLQYILRQKILLACHMLKETQLKNSQIAARLGYDDPAHFARTFRNIMKMTPKMFRTVGTIPMQ